MALSEIGSGTQAQMLAYRKRASINVIPGRGSAPGQVAERMLNPAFSGAGQLTLDPTSGSALIAISIESGRKIISILEGLGISIEKAIDDGVSLPNSAVAESFYTWKNDTVTGGVNKKSIAEYGTDAGSIPISVTSSYGLMSQGVAASAADGSYENDAASGFRMNAVDVYGHWIDFDFGEDNSRIVDEATWYSFGTTSSGVWRWEASNDGYNYNSIGDSFTLGGENVQVQDALADNAVGYQHYRLIGVSGTASDLLQQEVIFKSALSPTAIVTNDANVDSFSLNSIDVEIKRAIAAIDNLITAASISGANLIASTSRAISFQTTAHGGRMEIDPRPLDPSSLGIRGIGKLNKDNADGVLSLITEAIVDATFKIAQFQYIQNGLQSSKSSFAGNVSSGVSILPTGSLIDLLA